MTSVEGRDRRDGAPDANGGDRDADGAPGGGAAGRHTPRMTRGQLVATGLVLTLVVLVLGSVRFARYDWHGLPIERAPATAERQVSAECLERIRPYVTESGREIGPIVVDEQQYLALVAHYRGVPAEDLQVTCLYDPFTYRSGMSWVAHWLPFEEGLALGITNLSAMVLATWFVLTALRAQGFDARVVLAAGTLFVVGWNTFFFSSGILIDTGVLALVAIGWWLLSINRPWFVVPIVLLGYPIKETVGLLVAVTAAWAWQEHRAGRRSLGGALALAGATAVCFAAGVMYWRGALPESAASWKVTPDLDAVVHNLTDVISLASFAVGVAGLYIPGALRYRDMVRHRGLVAASIDPAVVGAVIALAISGWSFITVDLTPRLMWIGFPMAATLTAQWLSAGRPSELLSRLRAPRALVG